MRQPPPSSQHIQITQLRQLILRQDQIPQIRDSRHDRRLNDADPIPRKQQRPYPRTEREVPEDLDIVVGEVDRVLRTGDTQVFYVGYSVTWREAEKKGWVSILLYSKVQYLFLREWHTSEVELALFEGVEVGEGGGDELAGEPHLGCWEYFYLLCAVTGIALRLLLQLGDFQSAFYVEGAFNGQALVVMLTGCRKAERKLQISKSNQRYRDAAQPARLHAWFEQP